VQLQIFLIPLVFPKFYLSYAHLLVNPFSNSPSGVNFPLVAWNFWPLSSGLLRSPFLPMKANGGSWNRIPWRPSKTNSVVSVVATTEKSTNFCLLARHQGLLSVWLLLIGCYSWSRSVLLVSTTISFPVAMKAHLRLFFLSLVRRCFLWKYLC